MKNNLLKTNYEEPESNLFDSSPFPLMRNEPDSVISRPNDIGEYVGSPAEADTPLSKLILMSNRQNAKIEETPLKVITNSIIQQPRRAIETISKRPGASLPRPHGPQSAIARVPGKNF